MKCAICGKPLTSAWAKQHGVGPRCYAKRLRRIKERSQMFDVQGNIVCKTQ